MIVHGRLVPADQADRVCEECARPVKIEKPDDAAARLLARYDEVGDGGDVRAVYVCGPCLALAVLRGNTQPVWVAPEMAATAFRMKLLDGVVHGPVGVPDDLQRALDGAIKNLN